MVGVKEAMEDSKATSKVTAVETTMEAAANVVAEVAAEVAEVAMEVEARWEPTPTTKSNLESLGSTAGCTAVIAATMILNVNNRPWGTTVLGEE